MTNTFQLFTEPQPHGRYGGHTDESCHRGLALKGKSAADCNLNLGMCFQDRARQIRELVSSTLSWDGRISQSV